MEGGVGAVLVHLDVQQHPLSSTQKMPVAPYPRCDN